MPEPPAASAAVRAVVRGQVQGVGFREATLRRGRELGLHGWVRNADDGSVLMHVEGAKPALEELLAFLAVGPPLARVSGVEREPVAPEGHEQFAIRGVAAGVFVVQEHRARAHHFDLRLEVGGVMRSWALPKGPSLDPAAHNSFEAQNVIVWDRGDYEQGGRVAWPEALERGHAVFVLHGEKLRGGFALQRTGRGPKPQWLLIKRSDADARPGSDIVAERPQSVISGATLADPPD
jgi:acylphosphatase